MTGDTSLLQIQISFTSFLESIDKKTLPIFCKWAKNQCDEVLAKCEESNERVLLDAIREDIRTMVPQDGLMASENIAIPQVGENVDIEPETTVHMDAFLYEDDLIDQLCKEGKMSRNYCSQCGSRDVKPLTFISHSMCAEKIEFLYRYLLPDLGHKVVLDVGSRLGALLYGAFIWSSAQEIYGVEINADLCNVQSEIISKYSLTNRIKVICDDICNQALLVQSADVIILNNVFEFFAPLDLQKRIWIFLYENMRKSGSIIITQPSLENALTPLGLQFNLTSWVCPVDTSEHVKLANLHLYGSEASEDSTLELLHMYQVIAES